MKLNEQIFQSPPPPPPPKKTIDEYYQYNDADTYDN